MTLTRLELPDDIDVRSQAMRAGFSCVDDYVRELIERDVNQYKGADADAQYDCRILPRGEWRRQFRELLDACISNNPGFDDSRESIYPVR